MLCFEVYMFFERATEYPDSQRLQQLKLQKKDPQKGKNSKPSWWEFIKNSCIKVELAEKK